MPMPRYWKNALPGPRWRTHGPRYWQRIPRQPGLSEAAKLSLRGDSAVVTVTQKDSDVRIAASVPVWAPTNTAIPFAYHLVNEANALAELCREKGYLDGLGWFLSKRPQWREA